MNSKKYKCRVQLAPFMFGSRTTIATVDSPEFDHERQAEQFGLILLNAEKAIAYRVIYQLNPNGNWYNSKLVKYVPVAFSKAHEEGDPLRFLEEVCRGL